MKDVDRYDENGRKMEVSDYDGEKKNDDSFEKCISRKISIGIKE